MEREKIKLSDETLRGWLLVSGDWKKVRRRRVHRQWRERREHLGEMVQMDGSGHDWFEGRGPNCVLMGYIDDATGVVTDCKSGPVLQNPIKDPARFQWHEVKKVEHYYLSVDAVTRPMQIKENPAQFGEQEK